MFAASVAKYDVGLDCAGAAAAGAAGLAGANCDSSDVLAFARRSSVGDHARAACSSVFSSSIAATSAPTRAGSHRSAPSRQRAADAFDPSRQLGERRNLRHRGRAAERARGALHGLGVGAGRTGVEQQPIELLDVVARFENEKLEKPRRSSSPRPVGHARSVGLRESKLGSAASGVHGGAQLPHGVTEPDENRATHDPVTDVELLDLRDRRDGSHVLHGEAVARVYREPDRRRVARRDAGAR